MKPLAEHLLRTRYCSKDEQEVEVEVVGNTLPAQTTDTEKYIQHLADLVGPDGPNEDTYFIGQSIGCQVILRYLARLPPGSKVRVRRCFVRMKGPIYKGGVRLRPDVTCYCTDRFVAQERAAAMRVSCCHDWLAFERSVCSKSIALKAGQQDAGARL
jgi:pimeloyl-ACP methyl ester carboxylesterase